MLSVTVGRSSGKSRNDNQRAEHSDRANHVAQNCLFAPNSCGFFTFFRKAVLHKSGKELLPAIKPSRLKQFFGANNSKRFEKLRSDDILSAFAARQRKIRNARIFSAC